MSLDNVRRELRRFLGSDDPEVLVLKGAWGVGKTYTWNKILKETQNSGGVRLKKYSYVSLFGINSLDSFKFAIFEQQIGTNLIGTEPSLETFKTSTSDVVSSLSKKSVHLIQELPFVKNIAPALESIAFLSLAKTLVCVDDFERKGSELSARDVLGLLSALKEQKKCKIVLVLNDSSFEEESLKEYGKYKEKVVDIELSFNPSSAECVDIALDSAAPLTTKLREYVVQLKINNIRIIKKIERLAEMLGSALAKYEKEVLYQALNSLVLFAWSYYAKDEQVPSPDYLKNIGYRMYGLDEKEVSDQEKLWQSILAEYNYQTTDEFDLVIAKMVETGYADENVLNEQAQILNERVIAGKSDSSFEEAWHRYHDSFGTDDDDEVLQGIYDSFKKNTKYITPGSLNGTVKLFRDLNRNEQADEMIEHYIKARKDEKKLFDLEEYAFAGDLDDQVIIDRFRTINEEARERKTLKEALKVIAGKDSWGGDDAEVLANASVDEYFNLFKSERGRHLSVWVNACLKFGRFANASERDKQIARKATEALQRIARESRLNARRVAKYGVRIDVEETKGNALQRHQRGQ